jgi:hypothetical protein
MKGATREACSTQSPPMQGKGYVYLQGVKYVRVWVCVSVKACGPHVGFVWAKTHVKTTNVGHKPRAKMHTAFTFNTLSHTHTHFVTMLSSKYAQWSGRSMEPNTCTHVHTCAY